MFFFFVPKKNHKAHLMPWPNPLLAVESGKRRANRIAALSWAMGKLGGGRSGQIARIPKTWIFQGVGLNLWGWHHLNLIEGIFLGGCFLLTHQLGRPQLTVATICTNICKYKDMGLSRELKRSTRITQIAGGCFILTWNTHVEKKQKSKSNWILSLWTGST